MSLCLFAGFAAGQSVDAGFEQRVRNEIWDNVTDFNNAAPDARNQIRLRTRVWGKLALSDGIDVSATLNQESRKFLTPNAPFRFDEVIVETAYVDFKRLFHEGLSLRIGRQDLVRGEGFLLLEGSPEDGSRANYFNAANLAYAWNRNKIELLAISNPGRDRYLPRAHNRNRPLLGWDEQAAGAYGTFGNSVEAYYFYKTERNGVRDRRIQTAGGRHTRDLREGLRAVVEWAGQWGSAGRGSDIRANGGYAHLTRTFAHPWKPAITGGYWRLSGDDPRTVGRMEGWSPLFARWPKWSELYPYSQICEEGIGYATNMGMWQAQVAATPSKRVRGRLTVFGSHAHHPFSGDPLVFGSGRGRGNNYQGRIDVMLNANWRGHVVYEAFAPGSFYQARSHAHFFRWEVIYQISGSLSALFR